MPVAIEKEKSASLSSLISTRASECFDICRNDRSLSTVEGHSALGCWRMSCKVFKGWQILAYARKESLVLAGEELCI